MATELLDPSQVDAAIADAFGTKMPSRPSAAPAPLRTNNPGALMPGGKMAQYGSMEEGLQALDRNLQSYGKQGINTLSGVINKWSPGNAPGNTPQATQNYINHVAKVTGLKPDQQIDLSNPLVRLQLTAGITQFESGPGAVYGQAAPKRQAAPQPQAAALQAEEANIPHLEVSGVSDESMAQMRNKTPSQMSVEDLMKPEAIDAAIAEAFNEPVKPGKIASRTQALLRGSAALADTVYGVVPSVAGMATYAGARAIGQTPEQAAATQAQVTGQLERPFGKALGVTETPEYKGEASQRLMQFISENVDKGADWISQKTGMPKADVDYLLNLGLTAAPFSRTGQRVGQAVKQEAGYAAEAALGGLRAVTPEVVQRPIARAAEVVAPGITQVMPAVRPTPITPRAEPKVPTFGSVGAAAVPDAVTIRQALETATPEFQQLYGSMNLNKVNTPVVLKHLEADSLDVPVRLTEGQASGDITKLSREQNLRGSQPEYAKRFNEQNQQLVDNLQARRDAAAPDVYASKTIESSQALIDEYKRLDQTRNDAIDAKFTELRDKAGGDLPVDAATLLKNVDQQLSKELLLTDGQSMSQYRELKGLADTGTMTFDQYLSMRRNASRLSAEAKDGNVRQAARIFVQELDKLPLTNETAILKPIADQARSLARQRFEALKKDPAYKAAVDNTVPADKFFNKFVIDGVNKNINTMVDTFGRDSLAHQHMRAGTINWLSDKAGIVDGRGNFSQANYNKAVKKLDDVKNFQAIFDPESQLKLRTLGNVAAYTQFQPRGSFVNNSNTLVGYLANKAAGGLEQAGNIAGLKTFGYPLGTEARRVIRTAQERREAEAALKPGAGSILE